MVGVSSEALVASADANVVLNSADGVDRSTEAAVGARVDASAVLAGLGHWAIIVAGATDLNRYG